MKLIVASINPIKIGAVRDLIKDYPFLRNAQVDSLEINTGVAEQPTSLEETINGAVNRARSAFSRDYVYSFGIESGLMKVPCTKTGEMDFCACAVFDGTLYHLGLSCAFEFPSLITKLIHEEGINATQACLKAGLTKKENIGYEEGIIGIITNGRITRRDYTKQAVQMALIHLEYPHLYE